ncbi:MAG: NAD(P)H-quinone oxidoreductase [Acidobacteria bacterium]|nr:NAD(P)H-quinone oxidoreductase [Acidobacteriota bacterium]
MTTIPKTMRAVEAREPGGPDVLGVGMQPVPGLSDGELLIKVAAAGVNRADCMQRRGEYPPPAGASEILGLEVSGTVAALGEGVSGWREGDPVCALLAGGGYAEYCAVPAPQCLPVPSGVDLVDAAALPEVALTVWANVFERGGLTPGETLLVHGGSSGIGTMAIQLASALGSTVYVTAGSSEKCDACKRLGATRAFNYREVDFVEAVRSAAGGVDVILDMVGGPYLERNLAVLNLDGRLVIIALMGGARTEINLATLMRRRLVVTGTTLRARTIAEKGAVVDAVRARVWPLLESGRVGPVVYRRWPLWEAATAHQVMEASSHIGKLLLVV